MIQLLTLWINTIPRQPLKKGWQFGLRIILILIQTGGMAFDLNASPFNLPSKAIQIYDLINFLVSTFLE